MMNTGNNEENNIINEPIPKPNDFIISSLSNKIVITFEYLYQFIFLIFNIFLFFYKRTIIVYHYALFNVEFLFFLKLNILNFTKIYLSDYINNARTIKYIPLLVIISVVHLLLLVYYMFFQTVIFNLEFATYVIYLVFTVADLLYIFVFIFKFRNLTHTKLKQD